MVEILKTWWKARKIMKKPSLKFEFHWGRNLRGYPGNSILSWDSSDVVWKDKYDTPRFEYSPFFTLYLFGCLQFWFELDISEDFSETEYWEQLLWCLYYLKDRDPGRTLTDDDWAEGRKTWPWASSGPSGSTSTWKDEYHL